MNDRLWIKRMSLLFLGSVMLLSLSSCRHGENADKSDPIKVKVITIDTVRSGLLRTYVGEIEEKLSLSLSFATGGKVEKVMVHEGDYVREGIDNGMGSLSIYFPRNFRVSFNCDNGMGKINMHGECSQDMSQPLIKANVDNGMGTIDFYFE